MFFVNGERCEGLWKEDQLVEKRHVPEIMLATDEEYAEYAGTISRAITAADMLKSVSAPDVHVIGSLLRELNM